MRADWTQNAGRGRRKLACTLRFGTGCPNVAEPMDGRERRVLDDRLVSLAPETFQRAVRAIFLGRNLPDFLKAKVDAGNSRNDVR